MTPQGRHLKANAFRIPHLSFVKVVGVCQDRDIEFAGVLIASVENSDDKSSPNFSGTPFVKHKLSVYMASNGSFVVERQEHSQLYGHKSKIFESKIVNSESAVINFFGQGWLAKKLYQKADIDNTYTLL